jgi:hypothetical protein
MLRRLTCALLAALLLTAATGGMADAAELRFGPELTASGWTAVAYPGIRPADFRADGPATLDVTTDASAGMLWRTTDPGLQGARRASWRWRADDGVKPTDLSRRGKDDRILGIYFVFGRNHDIGLTPIRMLGSSSVTTLVYVFGGDKPRGTITTSPHMRERGKFIVLRPADAAKRTWHEETVDLARDFARAFDVTARLLIGIAIASDSDDTRGRNRASISNLTVE